MFPLDQFQDSVKLSDLGQGTNPVRIVAMRGLPDQPGDKEYPREEWIDQGKPPVLSPEEEAKKKEEGREDASLDDQSGDYVVRTFLFLSVSWPEELLVNFVGLRSIFIFILSLLESGSCAQLSSETWREWR